MSRNEQVPIVIAGHLRDGLLATHWTLAGSKVGERARWDLTARLSAAAEAGFDSVSLLGPELIAVHRRGEISALRKTLELHGLHAPEVEFLVSWADSDSGLSESELRVLDAAAAAGVDQVNVGLLGSEEYVQDDLVRRLRVLSKQVEAKGLTVALEFVWGTAIPSPDAAISLIERANVEVGMVFDTWHAYRSGITAEEIREIPSHLVKSVQFSDASAEPRFGYPGDMTRGRLLPGEGAIDLLSMIQAFDQIGADCRASIEMMSDAHAARSLSGAARLARISLSDVLSRATATDDAALE